MGESELLHFFNTYYVTNRKKYLLQTDSGYITIERTLSDKVIKKHIQQNETIGIFSGEMLSKFICFDIDRTENPMELLRELALHLEEEYEIRREEMLISFSGSKGYHLELFFSKPLSIELLRKFYLKVIEDMKINKTDIEFRPSDKQGVKLPFSINRKSGLYCFPVCPFRFINIQKEEALKVEKIETERFVDTLTTIELNNIEIFDIENRLHARKKGLIRDLNPNHYQSIKNDCLEVLSAGKLIRKGTRNAITFNLSLLLKSEGYTKKEIYSELLVIMDTTYRENREFFSASSDWDYIVYEIARITDFIFKKGYSLGKERIEVIEALSRDFSAILELKKEIQRLALSMFYHSRSFNSSDKTFYMTYEQMNQYGNVSDRATLKKMIDVLERAGFLEVVSRRVIDTKSLSSGEIKFLPNRYRIRNKDKIKGLRDKKIRLTEQQVREGNVDDVLVKLYQSEYLKEKVGQNVYYKRFSKRK